MRISTLSLYDQGITSMESAQALLAQTQLTLSTGKKVNTPADDPIAATEILQTTDAQSVNTQYAANQAVAKTLLTQTDSTLSQVTNVLQNVRTTLVSAGNGALTSNNRSALAAQLQSQLSQLVGLANTQDAQGNYLFGGYQAASAPFSQNATGVTYAGDDGVRAIQVTASRQIPATVSGDQVFQRIRSGNGVFVTSATQTNAGNAAIDTGQVTTPSALTGHNYSIHFTVAAGQTTYAVTDVTTGLPVAAPAAAGNVYTSGNAISFDGVQFSISGTPANGDTFNVGPSQNQSIFTTIQQAITMLQTPPSGSSSASGALGSLATSIQNVDQAMTQVSSVQAGVGTRENELTALNSVNTAADLQDKTTLSTLQDTDMAKAASNLAEQQTVLSAAEESFVKVTGNSLFNYIK